MEDGEATKVVDGKSCSIQAQHAYYVSIAKSLMGFVSF